MKKMGILILLLAVCLKLSATAQFGERLVWNGDTMEIFSEPLSLNEKLYNQIQKRLPSTSCTALWRGYIGEWSIQNDSLFLESINEFTIDGLKKIDVSDLVKNYQDNNGKVYASWVSDTLRIVDGKCLHYVHMGWESTYEKEWNVVVERGVVKNIIAFNNAIVIEGGSEPEIMETLNDFPIEKYPSINRVHVSVKGVKMDSVNNEISYDLEVRSKNLSEEVCEGIISDFQDLLKAKKFIRVYNANGELKCKTCIITIVRKRIAESRRR